MRLCARLVLASAMLIVGLLPVSPASPASPASGAPAPTSRDDRGTTVLHRVVWDQYEKRGTHLWSANPDGTDARKIYERPKGFVLDITLNRQGTEAAVSPTVLSAARTALVVVDVMGEAPSRNVIARHPEIYFVGGIGWSPNGRRLVFEGAVEVRPGDLEQFLFTVRRDGTGLRRVLALGRITEDSAGVIDNSLTWSPEGIFHYDEKGLHLLRHGRDRLVLGNVHRQAVSGDGNWLFLGRTHGQDRSVWRMHPDGTGLERLFDLGSPGSGFALSWQPSYDGSRLLSLLEPVPPDYEERVVVHDATQAPSALDQTLPFNGVSAITWN
jgi:hypothetical protein